MANEETFRTKTKLWLFNYFIVIVFLALHLSFALGTETKVETSENVTAVESNSTSQKPVAEALIRFRRQPPRTIVKHIIRPKRYKMKRVKRPKIKYSFAEPPTTYYIRKPTVNKKPTFDSSIFEDFSHMNVESADFDLPPSSYEAQSMDLDLYKHYEPAIEASYKDVRKPSLHMYTESEISYKEPSYTEVSKSPTYTYSAPEISFKETSKPSVTYSYTSVKSRKPHSKYGVPTELSYSTGYDKPSDNKYTFEEPVGKPVYTEVEKSVYKAHGKNEYSYSKPAKEVPRIPATSYGVPDVHIPVTGSNDYNKYSVVEQKPHYASYPPTKTETYHFAEPPQPEPSVEITYSPSYEINIPSSKGNSYSEQKYNGQHQPPQQHPPPPPPRYEEPSYQEHPNYEEPPQQYHPPENYQPADNYAGHPQENYEQSAEGSDTNQPESYHPAPPRHENIAEYIPHSQDLPINVNHTQPPYDYPKSSYEVPIYDPIPFEASNNQEREIYPPQTYDQSYQQQAQSNNPSEQSPATNEPPANNAHQSGARAQNAVNRPQSPINHLRRNRKRKRTKGSSTTVSTTKHILDVPELEEAFERENRNKFQDIQEPEANESKRFENINNQNNFNGNYNNGPWNPMKIRTSPIILMSTPSTVTAINTLATKNKRYHFKHSRTISPTTTTTTAAPAKVEIISIEKSKSKTYYDGIVSTPKMFNTNWFRNRYRFDKSSTSTTSQPPVKSTNENKFSKRTTKNVFETTIFKSPVNDKDVYRTLPKNHKLF